MTSTLHWRLSRFYFFYYFFVGLFTPYWGLYLQDLKFDAVEIGILLSLFHFSRIIAPNFWGWLADHTGQRAKWIRLSSFLGVLGFFSVFWADSYYLTFFTMMAISIFTSSYKHGFIIKDRSSIAMKGLFTHAGVIDAGYTGEIKILFHNVSATSIKIEKGDKISQLVPTKVYNFEIELVSQKAITVVIASKGYPVSFNKELVLPSLDKVNKLDMVTIYHSGTS